MGLEGLRLLKESVDRKGIRLHGPTYAMVGDTIIAVNNITRGDTVIIPEGTPCRIGDISIESQHGAGVGFSKKIKLDGFPGEFSPKKFRKHS